MHLAWKNRYDEICESNASMHCKNNDCKHMLPRAHESTVIVESMHPVNTLNEL